MAIDELTGGSAISVFDDSMAAAIEHELNQLLSADGKRLLPPDDNELARDRRRLIAALARGVIRHLHEHPQAFKVVFTDVPSEHSVGEFEAHVKVTWNGG